MDDPVLETVALYELRHEAEVARALLDSAGIEAVVVADDEGGLNPGFFARYGIRVVVRSTDLDDARHLLRAAD
jgi:hypothetical protein